MTDDDDVDNLSPEMVDAIEHIMLEEDRGQRPKPVFLGTMTSNVQVSWPIVCGATGYQVYRTIVATSWARPPRRKIRPDPKQCTKAKRQRRARTGRRK